MPVSETIKCKRTEESSSFSVSARMTISPSSVNLMAFPAKLMMTWRSLEGSPFKAVCTSGLM